MRRFHAIVGLHSRHAQEAVEALLLRHGWQYELVASPSTQPPDGSGQVDGLTGLPSREGLEAIGARSTPPAVVCFEVTGVAEIRRHAGAAAAGAALRAAALNVERALGPLGTIGRLYDETFAVLVAPVAGRSVEEIMGRIRAAVSRTAPPIGPVGSALDAHVSMYRAATNDDVAATITSAASMILRPRETPVDAVSGLDLLGSTEWLVPVAQPLVRLQDGVTIGYEMLTRIVGAGVESPDELFALSRDEHILTAMDLWCLGAAVQSARHLPEEASVHVNLFPSTVLEVPASRILACLSRSGLNLSRFCIELSERQHIGQAGALVESVAELRRAGVRLALDDVGFGYSSLEALVGLSPDYVKIDLRCVSGVAKDAAKRRKLARLLAVVNALGAVSIAEGVLDKADVHAVADLGVRIAQGYFLGRPEAVQPRSLQ